MISIDNVLLSLFFETLLGVFLLDTYNNVKTRKAGNIVEQWQNKNTPTPQLENTFFDNVFKRHGQLKDQGKRELKDVFVTFMNEMTVYFHTALIIFAVVALVYLLCRMCVKMIDKTFRTKSSHILQPDKFDGNQSVRAWLENFELYLEEDNITEAKQKCAALLSRLSGETRTLVANYGKNTKNDYNKMREALLHIYGDRKRTQTEYLSEFVSRNQFDDENLYIYHAKLTELGNKAYKDLDETTRNRYIANRFIDGILNDGLRQQILATFKNDYKNVLSFAAKLDEIYSRRQVNVSEIAQATIYGLKSQRDYARKCYNCNRPGHYMRDCIQPRRQEQYQQTNQRQNNSTTVKNDSLGSQHAPTNFFRLNRVEATNQLVGHCKIDGKSVKFLADTGATKTIIDVNMLATNSNALIKPANIKVILADGTPVDVLGVKTCTIQLGNYILDLEVLVTRNLYENCLLGFDFLMKCPATKEHITGLQQVLDGASGDVIEGNGEKKVRFDEVVTIGQLSECECEPTFELDSNSV